MTAAQTATKARTSKMNGHVPPQAPASKTKLQSAMDKLQAARDETLDAMGIAPLSPVRSFVHFVASCAVAGGAYYLVMQVTEVVVAASLAYFGAGFIAFLVAFLGLCIAMLACWQAYGTTRAFLDGVALGTIVPSDLARSAWDKVTGLFNRQVAA